MKIIEIINARRAIITLINRNTNKEQGVDNIPFALKYKLVKFIKDTDGDEEFFQSQFNELIEKYSEKDEEGKPVQNGDGYKVQEDLLEECTKKMEELKNIRMGGEKCNKFLTISELENLQIGYSETSALFPFIKEE